MPSKTKRSSKTTEIHPLRDVAVEVPLRLGGNKVTQASSLKRSSRTTEFIFPLRNVSVEVPLRLGGNNVSQASSPKRSSKTTEFIIPLKNVPVDVPLRLGGNKVTQASSPKQRTWLEMDLQSRSSRPSVLRNYAKLTDAFLASSLPRTVYFSHTEHTLTIFDAYPKALFHFLVLPRLSKNTRRPSASDLTNLRTLLRHRASTTTTMDAQARARGEETLRVLADEAARLRDVIEAEMLARYGFVWDVWVGFHPMPSMEHLHLHVISSDLTARALKTKQHYNSFSPRAGFFIPLAEVRVWFDAAATAAAVPHQSAKMRLAPEEYEPRLLKAPECFRCGQPVTTIPALKRHLQEEFDALCKRETGGGKSKKRRREVVEEPASDHETSGGAAKGQGKKVARLS